MNDGSFIAVDYGMPVHYTTDGGNSWTEIDNTLALTQAYASQATKMAGQTSVASYIAENGDIATGFAADLRDGYLFSSKTGDYSLSMSLSDKVSFGEVRSLDSETAEVNTAEVTPDETESSDEAEAVETVGTTLETENAETVETTAETADAAVETTEATDETETAAIEESTDKKEDVETAESSAETVTAEAAKASDENRAVEAAKGSEQKETARATAPAEEPVEQFARSAAAEISYPAAESTQSSTSPVKQVYEEMRGKISLFGKEKENSEPSIAEQVAVKKLYADVLYRNVYQDVDLRYALSGYNVKETIVVNQPRKNYSFTFYLDMQGLKPEQMKDGSIELRNERDEVVYLIPAPFMSDANGAESSAVAYKLAQSKSGAVQLTVIADEKWINDKERTFPVEIDPTLILYPYNGHDNILTSYVNSGRPNSASYNNTNYLRSGYYTNSAYDTDCTGNTVGFIYFNKLPRIPDHCIVTDAQLGLTQVKYGGTENINYHKLYATTIDTPSNPKSYLSQMTWNEYKDNILPKYAKFSGETTPTALACDNESNYRIECAYRGGKPLQVANFTESVKDENSNWKYGQRVNCYLSSADHASFRYFDASDYSYETSDYNTTGRLISQHYFDSWGRTVNVVSQNPTTGELLGVSTGAYTKNEQKSAKNNRLTNSASAGIEATNLLQNADFEYIQDGTPDEFFGWTKVGNGCAAPRTDSGTGTLVKPYHGKYLMKLFQWDKTDGDYRAQQEVYLKKNETYVFSAYVNTACTDAFGPDGNVFLSFLQKNTDGTYQLKAKSRVIDYKTGTAVNGGWERMEVAFTPTVSGTYAVAANVYNISAIAVFDDLKLEKVVVTGERDANLKTGTASAFNLLQADSFEFRNASTGKYASTNVNKWWSYDTSKACPSNKQKHTGSYSLTFAPSVTDTRRATQTVQINASSNKTYILSGWGLTPTTNIKSSKEMEEDNKNKCRFFGLIAKVSYTDGSTPDYHYVSFNGDISEWQFASGMIVPKQSNKTVSTITVSACLDYCANRAYMDDITLIQEPVQTYKYDDKGNLVSATNSEGKTSTTMDSKDRLTEYTAMNGVKYTLTYTGDSRDPATITSDGVKTSYTYDTAGNVTKTKTEAGGKYIQSSTTFVNPNVPSEDRTLDFPYETTDSNGNKSYTTYDVRTGLLLNTKNPKNVQTNNIYDENNNRIKSSYIEFVAALIRLYDNANGMLNQLTRKTYHGSQISRQAYSFDYDVWGNTTSIYVWKPTSDSDTSRSNSTKLANYTYDSAGKMTKMEYPSGQYVSYGYDSLDRLASEKYYNSSKKLQVEYQYIYSADGQLAKQHAVRNGVVTESYSFEYDSMGRLIRSREEGSNGIAQKTEHLYDTANRLTNQNWKVGDRDFKEIYSYNSSDGTMASMAVQYDCGNNWGFVTDRLTYSYDELNRLTKVLDTENATQFYTRNYKYQDLSGSQTTSRLAQFDYRKGNSDAIIYGNSYEYDKNGNIKQINEVFTLGNTEKSRVLAKYEYDRLNQLTKETRYTYSGTSTTAASTTVVAYDLDMAGNLYQVTENGSVKLAYTYGDSTWVDKLTAVTVNGTTKTIQYADALNPKTWFNGTDYTNLTWTQGRRLSSLKKGNQTYSYEYDMSGVRSVKVADGLKHEYVTQNGRVVRDTVTNASTGAFQYMLDFTYDESGHPLTMRRYYNEAQTSYNTYHYVVNGQGDVVKLLHGPNKTVAEYTYDAWGNLLSVSSAQSDDPTIAAQNPLRYRGYYYDTETGFYYLQSRYYDPALGRFISADTYSSTGQGFLGYNMFAYCGNNPVHRIDDNGFFWDTIFDIVSLCFSIGEVIVNPTDPWAWAGLGGDIIDLVPFVTGVGETTKAVGATIKVANKADDVVDTIHIVKAVDLTDDALDTIRTLDKVGDATQSTLAAGRQIHKGYKTGYNAIENMTKEAVRGKNRLDFLDEANGVLYQARGIIYELKPNNIRGIRDGIRQLQRYNKDLGRGYELFLELY